MLHAVPADVINVVIADDHAVVRSGLRMLLEAEEGLHVVAEAGDVPDAMRMVRAHRPRVAVLDLNMPGGSALEAIPQLRESTPETGIVVLTMQDDPAFARQALQNGALGFVLKEAADDELLEAIRLAARGETYLNPRLGARLPPDPPPAGRPAQSHPRAGGGPPPPRPGLSGRPAGRPPRARARRPASDRPRPHQCGDREPALP